ncbi:MAG: acetyl-CoA carboxylase biotin carboxylase subunit [Chloroflexota bacterium]
MTYFQKILIANRGEIAVRIMRACRELGIATVAVYTDVDRTALHVRHADEAYPIGPTLAYLDVDAIVRVAQQSGAQAIHPGYGFLSERAHFAQACAEAGIVFIGPPAEAIERMGSKIAAKQLAESVGVPTAPGYAGDDQSVERLRVEAERVGTPLLIKASAGGGGKGMRTIEDLTEFESALEGARREAKTAFGDDTVFLERFITRPRHVEIQLLADTHGNCVSLFERECSIQRRHQKIIEESPSPALSSALRTEMGEAAVRLSKAVGYCNAGTVEFMLDEDGQFYFLEMNTRLQVEHPVTEMVTGVDLVQLQIAVAAGAKLPFAQADLWQRGHAIEARIYAEDSVTFLPSTGELTLFTLPEGPGIRNDAGVATGDEVTVHYDPMLAKLIVAAPDRTAAIARLRRALADYAVFGVTTNLALLQAIAAHPAFVSGATTTDFLTTHDLSSAIATPDDVPSEVLAAVALGDTLPVTSPRMASHQTHTGPWQLLRHGIRLRYTYGDAEHIVQLTQNDDIWHAQIDDVSHTITVVEAQPHQMILAYHADDGQRIERLAIVRHDNEWFVRRHGTDFRLERVLPLSVDTIGKRAQGAAGHTNLESPMPGTVIKVLVEEGQQVEEHQPLVVLEAMKMEHIVAAPYHGVVRKLPYTAGALVAKGAVLVDLEAAGEE